MIATAAAGPYVAYVDLDIEDVTRSSYKNFLWASQENFHTSTTAEHLQDLNARTCWGGFQQDLHKIFSQGPVPDHVRTPRGFHQDLLKTFSEGPVYRDNRFVRACSRNAHGSVNKMRFTREFQEKCHVPRRRQPFSTSKRSWNADGHVTRVILRLNLQEKRWGPRPGQTRYQPCVRDCAVETHMDISQERCMLEFTANMPGIRARSLISYRKDPSVWAHWLGNRRLFLECVARVPVSLWGSGGSKENS